MLHRTATFLGFFMERFLLGGKYITHLNSFTISWLHFQTKKFSIAHTECGSMVMKRHNYLCYIMGSAAFIFHGESEKSQTRQWLVSTQNTPQVLGPNSKVSEDMLYKPRLYIGLSYSRLGHQIQGGLPIRQIRSTTYSNVSFRNFWRTDFNPKLSVA